tara:strand:+ start:130 stop:363 length:234 start_codon:yes stop_codon:yes gene_type:complete
MVRKYEVTLRSGKKFRVSGKPALNQIMVLRKDIKKVEQTKSRGRVVKKGKYYGVYVGGELFRVETNKSKAKKLANQF